MIKFLHLLFVLIMTQSLFGQIADWENYTIPNSGFIKESTEDHAFFSGDIMLENYYFDDPQYPYWTGWILSSGKDQKTPGVINEHSSIAGSGADGSLNYVVASAGGSEAIIKYQNNPNNNRTFEKISISNSTYAYLSMSDGDGFAKKFGGESGDDPDYFLLTIKGYINGVLSSDSIDFYLADFRFADNKKDYILKEWKELDIKQFANADSLSLNLSSSDTGSFGMNTPGYICVDNITTKTATNSFEVDPIIKFEMLTLNRQSIEFRSNYVGKVLIHDIRGNRIDLVALNGQPTIWYTPEMSSGIYVATFYSEGNVLSKKFINY